MSTSSHGRQALTRQLPDAASKRRRPTGTWARWLAPVFLGLAVSALAAEGSVAAAPMGAAPAAQTADEAPAGAEAASAASQPPGRRRHAGSPLERRVALLAKELDLNPAQQTRVKALLESQRQEVARVWSDGSIPSAIRISRTQAIGDRTADQIRALLDEAQRKKYIQPRVRETPTGTAGADVESWIGKVQRP
jgi:hypothetical protein